jgi:hypothetical protein
MADYASVRQRIISSVFNKLNANGNQETYVAHIKIWEDVSPEEGGKKPRYIIISSMYGAYRRNRNKQYLQTLVMEVDTCTSPSLTPTGLSPSERPGKSAI